MTTDTSWPSPRRVFTSSVTPTGLFSLAHLAPILVLITLAASTAVAQTNEPRPLRVEDMFRIREVSSPVVSPDGARAAYVVASQNLEDDSQRSDVWMVELNGESEARRMTTGEESAGSPAFSPDGRYLSFLAARGESATRQVWVMDLRGGEARPLTETYRSLARTGWPPEISGCLPYPK